MAYIKRFHMNGNSEIIERGLTLAEAKEHCSREDTRGGSYDDGTAWFDGFESDDDD